MSTFRNLMIAGCLCAAPGVHAAAISDMSIDVYWDTLAISGPLGSPVSLYDPLNSQTLFEAADGWVGANGAEVGYASAIDGADAMTGHTTPSMQLEGGYLTSDNISGGLAVITNNAAGSQSGWAGGYRGFFYQASGTGEVTVSVNYSVFGSVSTDAPFDYANGGYDLFMDADNADLWTATYSSQIAGGATSEAAELAANAAARLDTYAFSDWQAIESFGCWDAAPCTTAMNQSGVLSLTFNVVAGTNYFFGVDATVGGYTQVSAVPVPAALWLFGSGVVGLVGVARRRADCGKHASVV